jgi:hypothetical protein
MTKKSALYGIYIGEKFCTILFKIVFLLMIRTQVSATILMILTIRILLQKLGLCSYIDFIPSYGGLYYGYLKIEDGSEIGALETGYRTRENFMDNFITFDCACRSKAL